MLTPTKIQRKYQRLGNNNSPSKKLTLSTVNFFLITAKIAILLVLLVLIAVLVTSIFGDADDSSSNPTPGSRIQNAFGSIKKITFDSTTELNDWSISTLNPEPNDASAQKAQSRYQPRSANADTDVLNSVQDSNWVLQQPAVGFLVQLKSSPEPVSLRNYAKEIDSTHSIMVYPFKRGSDGQAVYGLSLGIFESYSAAMQAFQKLPASVRQNDPWIRSLKKLQSVIHNNS